MNFKKLITNLYEIKNSVCQVSDDFKKIEKLLLNTNFPLPMSMHCYVEENGFDIYMKWEKWEQNNEFRLLATKVIFDEEKNEYTPLIVPADNLRAMAKIKLYPYLTKFLRKIEEEAEQLKLFMEQNKIVDIEELIKE
jgi:hypothetical protein